MYPTYFGNVGGIFSGSIPNSYIGLLVQVTTSGTLGLWLNSQASSGDPTTADIAVVNSSAVPWPSTPGTTWRCSSPARSTSS